MKVGLLVHGDRRIKQAQGVSGIGSAGLVDVRLGPRTTEGHAVTRTRRYSRARTRHATRRRSVGRFIHPRPADRRVARARYNAKNQAAKNQELAWHHGIVGPGKGVCKGSCGTARAQRTLGNASETTVSPISAALIGSSWASTLSACTHSSHAAFDASRLRLRVSQSSQ
jgi:hypothetical protein